MSVLEIKNNIHKMVVETEDIVLLKRVEQFFQSLIDENYDWYNDLTSNQKELIQKGEAELDNKEFISNEAMKVKMKEYFSSKNQK